jgi:hypothetical protein
MEQATRRDEVERLLAEVEREFHEHEKTPTIQVLEPPRVTPVEVHMGEQEKAPLRETSPEGGNNQLELDMGQV